MILLKKVSLLKYEKKKRKLYIKVNVKYLYIIAFVMLSFCTDLNSHFLSLLWYSRCLYIYLLPFALVPL